MNVLTKGQKASINYHNRFDYPLNKEELDKWVVGGKHLGKTKIGEYQEKNGFYFVKGRGNTIAKRVSREKYSEKKLKIARSAVKAINFIPFLKMVGVTGSLAMKNAREDSDIDLLLITSRDTLWITRPFVYLVLLVCGFELRKPKDKKEQDKLCLNMWFDESDLVWNKKERNLYTAHELAQIVPLYTKNDTYTKLIGENLWITDYWPNSLDKKVGEHKKKNTNRKLPILKKLNNLAYFFQFMYMKKKMTTETVCLTRAIFHTRSFSNG